MKKLAKLRGCEIVQYLDKDYFKWLPDDLKCIEQGDRETILRTIGRKLQHNGIEPFEMHIIIHDKDVRNKWDDSACEYVLEKKKPHFHLLIKFKEDKGGTLQDISTAIGIEPQYIGKFKRGSYAYINALAYLIHIKHTDKYQYSPDEVFSLGIPGYMPYKDYYKSYKEEWEKGRASVTVKRAKENIDSLEEKILLGEIKRNQIFLTDEYYSIYAHNKRRCDDAFDAYAERKIMKTIKAMERGDFIQSVFYITGKSGSGKSHFTDAFVKAIIEHRKETTGEDWEVCSVAPTNPFDDYQGEEILVMDDLRGMSLSASDWLKLLDPQRISTNSARYRNKRMACRVIVINSERDVLDFFYYLKGTAGDKSEALDQFIRRIMAKVQVIKSDGDETRKISIGYSERKEPYLIDCPDPAKEDLKLSYGFRTSTDTTEMKYDDAIEKLVEDVNENNDLNDENI